MTSFQYRSYKKELLDSGDIPFGHIRQNMRELATINQYLGGHRITLRGLQAMLSGAPHAGPLHIVEVGCGGGNNLRVIKDWARKNNRDVVLTGIDINPECIAYAQSVPANKGIRFRCADYREAEFASTPHVIFSSLFCHHFREEELVEMLRWMQQHTVVGFFINDLHRHPLAYYSIKAITQLLSRSYLVRNDAPLSVQRGFKQVEWKALFDGAGINNYTCRWQWAFRWLVTYLHSNE